MTVELSGFSEIKKRDSLHLIMMNRPSIIVCCLLLSHLATGQVLINQPYDSNYYISYEGQLVGRYYFSQKYTAFRFNDRDDDVLLRYFPNTSLNMGIGATYKWA